MGETRRLVTPKHGGTVQRRAARTYGDEEEREGAEPERPEGLRYGELRRGANGHVGSHVDQQPGHVQQRRRDRIGRRQRPARRGPQTRRQSSAGRQRQEDRVLAGGVRVQRQRQRFLHPSRHHRETTATLSRVVRIDGQLLRNGIHVGHDRRLGFGFDRMC